MAREVDGLLRHIPEEFTHLGHWNEMVQTSSPLEIALVFHLQRRDALEERLAAGRRFDKTDDEFCTHHAIPPSVMARAKRWLIAKGLMVTDQDDLTLFARGSFQQVAEAFQITFHETYHLGRRKFRPAIEPSLPDWLAPYVLSVVGLDNVGELYPKYRKRSSVGEAANGNQGFFPGNIKTAYAVPPGLDGRGQTIGILEFSNGYAQSDLDAFWQAFQITPPTVGFVSVDGTPNDGGLSSEDLECTLDVEWSGAIAPGATLVVYEASAGSSDRAFGLCVLKSLRYVLNDAVNQPSVVTVSYGDGETRFAAATMEAWDSTILEMNAKGITVFIASGDQGAYGLHGIGMPIRHVDAPANCPHAVAVGGTHLVLDDDDQIVEETGWTDVNDNGASGGGISQVFSKPAYQQGIQLPNDGGIVGRGVPDVSLNADPDTGYAVVFQGAATVVGGTSVASPIWAAFTALLNQQRETAGKGPIGSISSAIYQTGATDRGVYRDIVLGNNTYFGVIGYECVPGWDAVTGFGSPDVSQWIETLA
jgi:kumamolisin